MRETKEVYRSDLLSDILSEITPQEQAKTDKRMLLAVKIAEAMKRKGLKKSELASMMGKQPSVITKWLSGTHNFELDTLMDLEHYLQIRFIDIEPTQREQIKNFHCEVTQKVFNVSFMDFFNDPKPSYPCAEWTRVNVESY